VVVVASSKASRSGGSSRMTLMYTHGPTTTASTTMIGMAMSQRRRFMTRDPLTRSWTWGSAAAEEALDAGDEAGDPLGDRPVRLGSEPAPVVEVQRLGRPDQRGGHQGAGHA